MVFLSGNHKAARPTARCLNTGTVPSWTDLVAFLLLAAWSLRAPVRLPVVRPPAPHPALGRVMGGLWIVLVAVTVAGGGSLLWSFVRARLTFADLGQVSVLALATPARVVVLIALASLIWAPIGVWIGLRAAGPLSKCN